MGGFDVALRSLITPGLLAARWLTSRAHPEGDDIPARPTSLGLAVKMALDEVFFLTEVISTRITSYADLDRVRTEVSAAIDFYQERGWLDDPTGYHLTPAPAEPIELGAMRALGLHFRHVSFESGYAPHPQEPGRTRWLGYEANKTVHAWVLEHPGPPRPWLVCVPGYRMGHPMVDFTGFPAAWLHGRHGLNIVIPVMPLHGPRRIGWRSGDGFLSGDYLDTIHMQSQAVWDVRRLIGWLRGSGAPAVGVYGVSLGGYTTALLTALEPELACVIAGIPVACYVSALRWNLPAFVLGLAERAGVSWPEIERLCRVISPLALAPVVPHERRFLYAALGDRLASPDDARALWHHWGRPRVLWYGGSHVSFMWERQIRTLLDEALAACGLRV